MRDLNGECEMCTVTCDSRDNYCDSCWEEISSDEVTLDYVPTEQDLRDMEVAFAFNPNMEILLESAIKDLEEFF